MSWAVEDRKDGLPGKALQKIQEIEGQLDNLKKERTQKHQKSEASAVKRENQSLVESCDALEKACQKATHDQGEREQQVSYLDGQLNTSKKTIERLEQELKNYKNEKDHSQPSHSSDLQSYSTPQKTFATPAATPIYRQHDSRLEDLQERYNQEVEVKLLNQSSVSNKDIAARQQAGSSVFPRQQQDQGCQSKGNIETPLKRRGGGGTSSDGFLWNAEETPIKPGQRFSTSVSQFDSDGSSSLQMEQLMMLKQELKNNVS
ncbi:hypothetical protein J4Q44_G00227280 [Coregonus suidteri]|uniref:Centromere protein Cenp-F N-terminal domain-containing protein n=1 Tax=Coregonus suidteri TaxID=861788 RepID=A0AAN8QLH0_9TELE